jgi:copper chaperone
MTKKVSIEGMTCEHCKAHAQAALENIKGIIEVEVNLEEGYALVTGDYLEDEVINEAIEEAGYEVKHIAHV